MNVHRQSIEHQRREPGLQALQFGACPLGQALCEWAVSLATFRADRTVIQTRATQP